jgi:O-antigen/teichoic acid export membrane protein
MVVAVMRSPLLHLRQLLQLLSLTPFDTVTPEGRAKERHRRVALTGAASALAKVVTVATALFTVPLTLHYLGTERFGMWMTISSLIAMLAFADFGIANGLLSAVAEAHGRDDRRAIAHLVSSAFFMLTGIAVALLLLFAVAYPWVHWPALFNVQNTLARAEAGPALAVFVLCFAAAIPLGMVQRVQMGLQQGFAASLWACVGSLCGLAGVLLTIHLQAGLPWLVLALAGVPLLAALLNSLYFYGRAQPDLRPRWGLFSSVAARQVAASGGLFFVLQLTVAVAYTSDSLVIAHLLGASAVADYAVPEKMFGLITLALAMVLSPLWPAYGEAIARGDHAWVRRTLKRSLLMAVLLAAAASVGLLWAGPTLMRWWVGDALTAPFLLMLALAAWKVVEAGGNAVAVYLNGAHVIGLQVVVAAAVAVSALTLKFWFIPMWGVAGAVWATVVAYLLFAALPYALFLPRLVRK